MKINGEHNHGTVDFIEAQQVQAKCQCGWNTRVSIPRVVDFVSFDSVNDEKERAVKEARRQLQDHQDKRNKNPDEGVQL